MVTVHNRRAVAFAWLGHPVTLAALVVLVVNDHVLKAAAPGWVTGKLSDAAGLVLAPPLVAAVLRLRGRRIAVTVVGALFTLVKAVPAAAAAASAAWSLLWPPSLVRADRTDLLTLPFLLLAAASWTGHPRPAGRLVRALRVAVVLPLALAGVAATSAVEIPEAQAVLARPDGLYLGRTIGVGWLRSTDGARSWIPVAPPKDAHPVPQQCSAAAPPTCYRVLSGAVGVQVSTDGGGTWTDSWRITERQRLDLGREYDEGTSPERRLYSTSVAVGDLPSGGHVVLVANGADGFARRDADGTWRRIGFPTSRGADDDIPALGPAVPYDTQATWGFRVMAVALAAGLVLLIGAARTASQGRLSRWWIAPAAVAVVVPLAVLVVARAEASARATVSSVLAAAVVLAVLAAGGVVTAVGVARGPGGGTRVLLLWGVAVLTVAAETGVWLTWAGVGRPGLGAAAGWAVLAALPGLAAGGLIARYGSGTSVAGGGTAGRWPSKSTAE